MYHKPLYHDQYLFVYDTLQSTFQHPMRSILIDSAEYIGKAHYPGRLYITKCSAVVVPHQSGGKVWGEVYGLNQTRKVLASLDQYKDSDVFHTGDSKFYRQEALVYFSNGTRVLSWIYLYDGSLEESLWIPDGNYAKFVRDNKRKTSSETDSRIDGDSKVMQPI